MTIKKTGQVLTERERIGLYGEKIGFLNNKPSIYHNYLVNSLDILSRIKNFNLFPFHWVQIIGLSMIKRMLMITVIFLLLINVNAFSQVAEGFTISAIVVDGDTILMQHLPQIIIKDRRTFKSKRHAVRYNRLVKNVKKVYPYSRLAASLLRKYEDTLSTIESKSQRKKLMKQAEKELWDTYGEELQAMTMTQGLILIKLIDRQTGKTSYELVSELRSGLTAFIFQGIARLFRLNLKDQYNEGGDDQHIEDIVLLIEHGDI